MFGFPSSKLSQLFSNMEVIMDHQVKIIPEYRYFKLPFLPETRILQRETLLKATTLQKKKRGLRVFIKELSFVNEVLTAKVCVEEEPAEYIFFRVTASYLYISCSVDTDETYLSAYASLYLDNLLLYRDEMDFSRYYYPDTFDEDTGKSNYLKISRKDNCLSIMLKQRYQNLFKPGDRLPPIHSSATKRTAKPPKLLEDLCPAKTGLTIVYCFLDAQNFNLTIDDCKEIELLVPMLVYFNSNSGALTSLISYITPRSTEPHLDLMDGQIHLNSICAQMWLNSKHHLENTVSPQKAGDYMSRLRRMFDFWEQVLPLLCFTNSLQYCPYYHLRYVKGKPKKMNLCSCTFSAEIPKLVLLLKDKGDYFVLELKFSIYAQRLNFYAGLTSSLFIASNTEPKHFYLLGCIEDAELYNYFKKIDFRLPILKRHYNSYFASFAERLNGDLVLC